MSFKVSVIKPHDDIFICEIIKQIGAEFGAVGEGFGPSDAEVLNMSAYYLDANSAIYLIATKNNQIVGGCGIACFDKKTKTCELRKLFLLPSARGLGIGKALSLECLDYAKSAGYQQCYLDTLSSMESAIALYEKLGFVHLSSPIVGTIHGGCDVWMLKEL